MDFVFGLIFLFAAFILVIMGVVCISISIDDGDLGFFFFSLMLIIAALPAFYGFGHMMNWSDRKDAFEQRYHVQLIKLTDDHARYVTPGEKTCIARVTYKPSDPSGELYIVKGSKNCKPAPKIDEGVDSDGN